MTTNNPKTAPTAPPPPQEEPISSDVRAPKKAKRGQKSIQANKEKFRERRGDQFMAENTKRLDQILFRHLSNLTTKLSTFKTTVDPKVCNLPITTRGVGAIVAETHHVVSGVCPSFVTAQCLYRVSLLQMEQKLRVVYSEQQHTSTVSVPTRQLTDEFCLGQVQLLKENRRNFSTITAFLNTLGNFETYGKMYYPYVPLPSVRGYTFMCRQDGLDSVAVVHPEDIFGPDPYVTTFHNLRSVTNALANEATPEYIRRHYALHNSIPGAVFDENYILQNAAQIIPAVYGLPQIRAELLSVAQWLDSIPEEYAQWRGQITESERGVEALLVNAQYNCRVAHRPFIRDSQFSTPQKISDQQFCLGILGLTGEYPDSLEIDGHLLLPPPGLYAPRHHSTSGMMMAIGWDDVIGRILTRH